MRFSTVLPTCSLQMCWPDWRICLKLRSVTEDIWPYLGTAGGNEFAHAYLGRSRPPGGQISIASDGMLADSSVKLYILRDILAPFLPRHLPFPV